MLAKDKPCFRCKSKPRYTGGLRCSYCVECKRLTEAFFKTLPEYRAKVRSRLRLQLPALLLRSAKIRASIKGVPFNISLHDIKIPEVCPVLGVVLRPGTKADRDNSPSLDRLVPALGYVVGNIRVISWRANKIKSDASLDELERVLRYVKGEL